jgi:putative transport protein
MLDQPIFLLLIVILAGELLGRARIADFSLGSSGILFAALVFGHFGHVLPDELQTLGLVLFIYAVGLEAGPGFGGSFRHLGLRLTAGALAIVGAGLAAALACGAIFGLDAATVAGVFAGALTSTPGLAVAVETAGPGAAPAAYGLTYVIGVVGVILGINLLPRLLRVDLGAEADALSAELRTEHPPLGFRHLALNNPNIFHRTVAELGLSKVAAVTLTRLLREGAAEPILVHGDTELLPGDRVRIVGRGEDLDRASLFLGQPVDDDIRFQRALERRRVVVSRRDVVGMTLGALNLDETFDVQISRVTRSGIELTPSPDRRLHMGDALDVVGNAQSVKNVARTLGDDLEERFSTSLLPLLLGLGLGMLVGQVPIELPVVGTLRLGTAGGVLLAGLVAGSRHKTGPLLWAVPRPTLVFLRDLGLMLFLATVGTHAGASLLSTLAAQGAPVVASGVIVTLTPLVVGVLVGRLVLRLPALRLLGVLAGGMTSTPGLAASASQSPTSFAASAYATVYPAALIAMILAVKIILAVG